MKKFTLLLCLFVVSVMMPQSVLADYTVVSNGALSIVLDDENSPQTMTITSSSPGLLRSYMESVGTDGHVSSANKTKMQACTTIVLINKFKGEDLASIESGQSFSSVTTVDMSDAIFMASGESDNPRLYSGSTTSDQGSLGAKAYFNVSDNLWRCVVSNTRQWTSFSDLGETPPTSADHTYNTWSEMDGAKYNHDVEVGQTGRYPTNDPAVYYQMHVSYTAPENYTNYVVTNPTVENAINAKLNEKNFQKKFSNGETVNIWVLITKGSNTEWGYNNVQVLESELTNATFYAQNYNNSNINSLDGNYGEQGSTISFPFKYTIHKSWVSESTATEPSGATIVDNNYSSSDLNNITNVCGDEEWVRIKTFEYFRLTQTSSCSWEKVSFQDGNQSINNISHNYTPAEWAENPTAQQGEYAVVGATLKQWNGTEWSTNITEYYDWTQMKFEYWSGTLTTAILPDNISASQFTDNVNPLRNCSNVTTVQSGSTVATTNFNNHTAELNVASGTSEFSRMEAILRLNNCITTFTSSTVSPSDNWITLREGTTDVYDVHVTTAGSFATLFAQSTYADGATFVFDEDCVVDQNDLLCLATNGGAKYYVDLFDIPTTNNTIETALNGAITTMQGNDKQFRGLIWPKDRENATTQLIKDNQQGDGARATCTEFIAYKKSATIQMYIYNAQSTSQNASEREVIEAKYQTNYNKLVDMMKAHNEGSLWNNLPYSVSTNSVKPLDISSLPAGTTKVQTINDDMVKGGTTASIYVYPTNETSFSTVVNNSNLKSTPTEKIAIVGPLLQSDMTAVNDFTSGPRVLDLSQATFSSSNTSNIIDALTNNSDIEYIILPPENMPKNVVCNEEMYYSTTTIEGVTTKEKKLSSLKCVISSNSTDLIAYLIVPGSLAEARCLATGNDAATAGDYFPTPQRLSTVTLAGKLWNKDISTANGGGLANEKKYITSIDLEKAVFYNQQKKEQENKDSIDTNEMNFNNAGFIGNLWNGGDGDGISLSTVILPTSEDMNELSKNCLYQMHTLTEICIPYNYQILHEGALNETGVSHVTTTSALEKDGGILIDKGEKTITLSANITQLGDAPETKIDQMGNAKAIKGALPVFPKNNGVTDIYPLATKVPKCYKDVFGMDLSTGYGGQDPSKVYCRERYYNNGEADKAFVVLHIPNEVSFNSSTGAKESSYSDMVKKYTDDTKKYSKLDQTGAVDGNGNPLRWPTHLEMLRVYKQASAGLTWDDWNEGTNIDATDGFKVLDGPTGDNPSINENTSFYDYIGWHQIVLCLATHIENIEIPDPEEEFITRNYVQPGWYTFCIPYNLTYSQVLKMMGVPKSAGNVKNYVDGAEIDTDAKVKMPDIRQLDKVVRKKGDENNPNKVIFRLTENLYQGNKITQYLDFTESDDNQHSKSDPKNAGSGDDPICLIGGRPYYIMPYLPEGVTPSKSNLGKYIMTRYADELNLEASCVNSGEDYCEQLEIFTYNDKNEVTGVKSDATANMINTMRFAKPYEKHKVQAVADDETNAGQLVYTDGTKKRSTATYRYYYTMVGQFWEQDLPEYCFYMSGQQWSRYTDATKKWKWAPYKCVILATPEVTCIDDVEEKDIESSYTIDMTKVNVSEEQTPATLPTTLLNVQNSNYSFNHFGGGFRNIGMCYFPMNMPGTQNLLPSTFSLCFFGRNDYSFQNDQSVGAYQPNNSQTRYIFSFGDDDIEEFDDQGNETTVIQTLDGAPQFTTGDSKVYNLSGQYVGKSTEGLAKGIYVVGGRKIVVEQCLNENKVMKRKYLKPTIRTVSLCLISFITVSGGSSENTGYQWGDDPNSMGQNSGDPEAEGGSGGGSRPWGRSMWDDME